jgi:hypothetical protein
VPSAEDPTVGSKGTVPLLVEDRPPADRDLLLGYEEWRLALRVAESSRLRKSELLPKFLLYVCEQYLSGREAEISEQRIGIQVFNRPENYNPGEDNIVRSYARLLRKRLDAYFESEGAGEPIRIFIPRGGYIPCFEPRAGQQHKPVSQNKTENESVDEARAVVAVMPSPQLVELPAAPRSMRRIWRSAWLLVALGLFAGILLTSAGWMGWNALQAQRAGSPARTLWARIFSHDRNALIVVTDSGLGILENLTRSSATIEDYANGSYLSGIEAPTGMDSPNFNDLLRQRYTSVVSLNVASALMRLPEFVPDRAQIRFAREVSLEDLKSSNVVLIGAKHTNPWVALFEDKLNFRLEFAPNVDESYIVNLHPIRNEQKVYRNSADSSTKRTYGAIAFVPSLDGAGHALIVEGLNMAATEAAADVLFKPSIIRPILDQATSRTGELRPFELLVETTSVAATAPDVKVIATRIGPQQ